MIDRIARFVLLTAQKQPRIIVIDDVHWADDSSLDCLSFLAPELPKSALLIVICARDGFLSEDGGEELGLRMRPQHRIELSGLSAEDVERYVLASTGWVLAPEVHEAMHTKSGGNPLFLEETVRVLLAREPEPSSVQADAIDVPRFARDIVQARLQGVSAGACEFLEIASAIGQEFTLPLIQAAMTVTGGEVLAHLDEAHGARLVIRGQSFGAIHTFAHDAIRETLYAELSSVRRVDVHLRLADALESRPDGALGSVAELAFHLHRALPEADPARAESRAREAAVAAVRRCAHEDVAKFYGWALDAQSLRDSGPLERCELLIELGGALRMWGKETIARERIGEAIAIARQHRSGPLLYEAATRLRAVVSMAILPDELVRSALEEASELSPSGPSPLRVRILALLACIPPYSTDPARSRSMAERAEAMARPLGDDAVLAQALLSRLPGLSAPEHLPQLLAIAGEVAGGSLQATLFQRTEAHQARYHALLMRADRAESDRAFEDVRRLAGMLRGTDKLWQCTRLMATRDFHAGRLAAADATFDELRVRAERLRLSYASVYRGSYLSASARLRGGSAELIAVAPEVTAALSWISHLPVVTASRSLFLLCTGLVDAARAEFNAFWDKGLEQSPGDQSSLHTLGALSYVAVRLGDQERALTLYERLLPFDGLVTLNAVGFHHGPVAHHLGALALVLERPEDAVSHLEDALATCRRMGWALHEPQTLTMLSRALFGRGHRTDVRRAQACLLESHALATDLGLRPELQQIEAIAHARRVRLPKGGGAASSGPPDRRSGAQSSVPPASHESRSFPLGSTRSMRLQSED